MIRPSGSTAVASTITRPTPPAAREARWARWKSVATPVSGPSAAAEYMHIGAIQTRLAMVSSRRVIGSNKALTAGLLGVELVGTRVTVLRET